MIERFGRRITCPVCGGTCVVKPTVIIRWPHWEAKCDRCKYIASTRGSFVLLLACYLFEVIILLNLIPIFGALTVIAFAVVSPLLLVLAYIHLMSESYFKEVITKKIGINNR